MPRLAANLAGCAAVLVAVGALSVGLPAVNDAISAQRAVSATEPFGIGAGVSVTPPSGTVVDADGTVPSANQVLFVRGGVSYKIRASPFDGTVDQLAGGLRREVADARGPQGVAPETGVTTDNGMAGRIATFEETDGAGFYAAYVSGGVGVTSVVIGTDQGLLANGDAIRSSLATLTFGGPP